MMTQKPAALVIVPPYSTLEPPACAAYLLAYAAAHGCAEFDFVDLRLGIPHDIARTYSSIGCFGESYVMDIPDLPLVLSVVAAFDAKEQLLSSVDKVPVSYFEERALS